MIRTALVPLILLAFGVPAGAACFELLSRDGKAIYRNSVPPYDLSYPNESPAREKSRQAGEVLVITNDACPRESNVIPASIASLPPGSIVLTHPSAQPTPSQQRPSTRYIAPFLEAENYGRSEFPLSADPGGSPASPVMARPPLPDVPSVSPESRWRATRDFPANQRYEIEPTPYGVSIGGSTEIEMRPKYDYDPAHRYRGEIESDGSVRMKNMEGHRLRGSIDSDGYGKLRDEDGNTIRVQPD